MKNSRSIFALCAALGLGLQAAAQQTEWMQGAFSPAPCGPVDTTNLAAWWPMDVITGGNATPDLSGTGNTLALGGSTLPSPVPGIVSNAIAFDGNTGYGQASVAVAGFPMTQMAWVKLTNATVPLNSIWVISDQQTSGSIPAFYSAYVNYASQGGPQLRLTSEDASGNEFLAYYDLTPDSAWHHIAWVSSSANNFALYMDGASISVTTITTGTPPAQGGLNQTVIGGVPGGGANLPGYIDDVRFYPRALSGAEILTIYQHGSNGCP